MKNRILTLLTLLLTFALATAQTPQAPDQTRRQEDDTIRISTTIVQTDVVVTDKNDQVIPDLKLGDFEVYEDGKKQDLKFIEFVSVANGRRAEGTRPTGAAMVDTSVSSDVAARDVKRVFAFVVDDLTIPYADLVTVRLTLRNFVDNQMSDGDLVAIVRTVGGKGMLQQFTSDRQLLRRAIDSLNIATNPFSQFNNPDQSGLTGVPRPSVAAGGEGINFTETSLDEIGGQDLTSASSEIQRYTRGLIALQTADYLITSLKELPGRKSLVMISGGIPIFEAGSSGSSVATVSYVLHLLSDHAARAGVAISTLDPRGLKATPGVVGYSETPGRSALSTVDPTFGRGGAQDLAVFGPPLAGGAEHLGLSTLASATGGQTIFNTNDFKGGLEKIVARSSGYYILAYAPTKGFDNKFRKLQIKVKRDGARVYKHDGYVATEDRPSAAPRTKEQAIVEAMHSPLAKRDVDVGANVTLRMNQSGNADVGVNLLIDPRGLKFTQSPDGKYQDSFDVVGFVYDPSGKLRGGFSETVKLDLTAADYQRAQTTGLTYSANTVLPPGYFQIRAAVRETDSGSLGTLSRYLEIPDLSNGKLAMSSLFLFGAAPPQAGKVTPTPLLAVRRLTRQQDLRYVAVVYNVKEAKGNPQLRSQIIISQNNNTIYKEPEHVVETKASSSQVVDVGQLGLSKVKPGRYVLTLVVTDPLADKKTRTISRSVDFIVE